MSTPLSMSTCVLSAVKPDATKLPQWPITGAVWVSIGATCSIASGSLSFRLIFTDATGTLTGVSPSFTLLAAPGPPDWASVWLGTPQAGTSLESIPVCGDLLGIKVDAITGTWSVALQSFVPLEPSTA